MSRLITERVKLNVEIYSDDIAGMNVARTQYDTTSFGDATAQYVYGAPDYRVELTSEAAARIFEAFKQAMLDNAAVRTEVERSPVLRRAIKLSGGL